MWRFASASTTGTSHLKTNKACQDRLACELLPGDTLVAIIADGAGSAEEADRGAELVVESVVAFARQAVENGRFDYEAILREGAAIARARLVTEAEQTGMPLRDYSSTVLAVILAPGGGAAMQRGDGVIVVSEGNDEWAWLYWPQRGQYANTTFFLTDENALEEIVVEPIAGFVTDLALMSDGLEPLALHYATETAYSPFFNAIFSPLFKAESEAETQSLSTKLEQFLASDRVTSRTDDDVSLILATRRSH